VKKDKAKLTRQFAVRFLVGVSLHYALRWLLQQIIPTSSSAFDSIFPLLLTSIIIERLLPTRTILKDLTTATLEEQREAGFDTSIPVARFTTLLNELRYRLRFLLAFIIFIAVLTGMVMLMAMPLVLPCWLFSVLSVIAFVSLVALPWMIMRIPRINLGITAQGLEETRYLTKHYLQFAKVSEIGLLANGIELVNEDGSKLKLSSNRYLARDVLEKTILESVSIKRLLELDKPLQIAPALIERHGMPPYDSFSAVSAKRVPQNNQQFWWEFARALWAYRLMGTGITAVLVAIWGIQGTYTPKPIWSVPLHSSNAEVKISPSRKILVVLDYPKLIGFDPRGGHQVWEQTFDNPGIINYGFSPDASTIGVLLHGGHIKLLNALNGQLLANQPQRLEPPDMEFISEIVFSSDSKLIATRGTQIRIWSVPEKRLLNTIAVGGYDLGFLPNNQSIYTIDNAGIIHFIDINGSECF
jgi:hypothetical protein